MNASHWGKYTDAETGFQYLRARYYDPATGQFLTRDPLTAQTQAPYSYGADSPLNNRDPSGLSSCGDISLGGLVDCGSKAAAGVENAIIDITETIQGPGCGGAIAGADDEPHEGPLENGRRHVNDICEKVGTELIGGDIIITWRCIDIYTNEVYRYQTIVTFPGMPPLQGGTMMPPLGSEFPS